MEHTNHVVTLFDTFVFNLQTFILKLFLKPSDRSVFHILLALLFFLLALVLLVELLVTHALFLEDLVLHFVFLLLFALCHQFYVLLLRLFVENVLLLLLLLALVSLVHLSIELLLHLDAVFLLAEESLALLFPVHHRVVLEDCCPLILVVLWLIDGGLIGATAGNG